MGDGGNWIKLYRQLLDSDVFADAELLRVWIWCLLRASFKERVVMMPVGPGETEVRIGPGQFVYGRKSAGKQLQMTPSTFRRKMKRLEAKGNVVIEPDTHYSIATIVNWSRFQSGLPKGGHPSGQAADRLRTGCGQAVDTYKKGKNSEKGKNARRGRTLGETGRDDHIALSCSWNEEERKETLRFAQKIGKVVGVKQNNSERDRSIILKVARLLAAGTIPESWVDGALEAIRHGKEIRNRQAVFRNRLEEAAGGKAALNRMLAKIVIPSDLLNGKE